MGNTMQKQNEALSKLADKVLTADPSLEAVRRFVRNNYHRVVLGTAPIRKEAQKQNG